MSGDRLTDQARVRPPAVAGLFYPADPAALEAALDAAFTGARIDTAPAPAGGPHVPESEPRHATPPKALIVPHAGYVYSGPVAASAYRRLVPGREKIRRVVLLGPSHRVPLHGLAAPGVDAFATPLGPVPVDDAARETVLALPGVTVDDNPHAAEHSLEVQLPFLQAALGDVAVLPLAVGRATVNEVSDVLLALWGGPETLVVVSTDLSHYEPYDAACAHDRRTATAVVARQPERIGDRDACGAFPLRGLLDAARRTDLTVEEIDLRNSGDTAGDRQRVVGYGSFALT